MPEWVDKLFTVLGTMVATLVTILGGQRLIARATGKKLDAEAGSTETATKIALVDHSEARANKYQAFFDQAREQLRVNREELLECTLFVREVAHVAEQTEWPEWERFKKRAARFCEEK